MGVVAFVGLLEVVFHGPFGSGRVVFAQGLVNGFVFGQGGLPGGRFFKVVAQALKNSAIACLPVTVQGVEQHAVATGLGNGHVKSFVTVARHLVARNVFFHLRQRFGQGLQIAAVRMHGGQCGHFGLDQFTRLHDLQRPPVARAS